MSTEVKIVAIEDQIANGKYTASIYMDYESPVGVVRSKVWSWPIIDKNVTEGFSHPDIARAMCCQDFARDLHAALQFFQMTRKDGNMIVVATPD